MGEIGKVTEIKGDTAVLRMKRVEACAKCRACLAGFSEKVMVIEAENECNAKVDDWVEIKLQEDGFAGAVLILYGIPLIGLLAGVLLGYFVLSNVITFVSPEILGMIFGLIGIFICHLFIKSREEKWKAKKYRPIAARIVDPDEVDN